MITLRSRGRGPMTFCSSSTVLIFRCRLSFANASITGTPARLCLPYILEPGLGGFADRVRIPKGRIPPIVDFAEDARDPLLEWDLRLPAEVALDLARVGPGHLGLAGPRR